MRLPFFLFWGIASSVALSSREVNLPYIPSIEPDHSIDSYLTIKWSIQDRCLYANKNQIFPPTTSMLLQVPHIQGTQNTHSDLEDHDLDLSYSLEVSPLLRGDASPDRILRVKVELLDLQGRPVTPNSVELDLISGPDGSQHITRIRLQPGSILHGDSPHDRPWQMKFWKTQVGAMFKPKHAEHAPHPVPGENFAPFTVEEDHESHVGYSSSPYWSPTYMRHHHGSYRLSHFLRPVILPALLGAIAGLAACLVGFMVGHVFISLSTRIRSCRQPQQTHSPVEDIEKTPMIEFSMFE